MFYVGLAKAGRVPDPVPDQNGGDAVHRGVLDTGIRRVGRGRLQVWLVNARDTKNLPGRKSDVLESQWLLKLHAYGLLRKSFRPTPENTCLANVLAGPDRIRPARVRAPQKAWTMDTC